jgi:hypothetical protein
VFNYVAKHGISRYFRCTLLEEDFFTNQILPRFKNSGKLLPLSSTRRRFVYENRAKRRCAIGPSSLPPRLKIKEGRPKRSRVPLGRRGKQPGDDSAGPLVWHRWHLGVAASPLLQRAILLPPSFDPQVDDPLRLRAPVDLRRKDSLRRIFRWYALFSYRLSLDFGEAGARHSYGWPFGTSQGGIEHR